MVQGHDAGLVTVLIEAIDKCDYATRKVSMSSFIRALEAEPDLPVKLFLTSLPQKTAVHLARESSVEYIEHELHEKRNFISQDVNLVVQQK